MAQGEHSVNRHITGLFSLFGVIRICLIIIVASMLAGAIVIYKLDDSLSGGYSEAVARISGANYSLFPTMVYSSLFQLFVAISAVAAGIIFYSHKVVGPIYRFTVVFREIAEGKLQCKTRIRKGDQLQSVAAMINFMKCGLRGFLKEINDRALVVEDIINSLEQADEAEREAIKERLREETVSLEELVSRVKLDK